MKAIENDCFPELLGIHVVPPTNDVVILLRVDSENNKCKSIDNK